MADQQPAKQQVVGQPVRTYGGQAYAGEPMVLVPASSVVSYPPTVVVTDAGVYDDWGCALCGLLFAWIPIG